ncbi:hypothetical protein A1O3_01230 [Capronia epimyces CBS 606.96]|uniref:Alcohol dehydrogenase n=1 Tax=Capronia epimyces CBS 606.96 TaxID=1182542 RepID=W9YJE5_9EURO|nr:uncharacterized protein A1O3_01230 [Capronia epimyces CBS 606.96]EXJ92678.1 hypothetical protein A1O3_01230 [Capronia epimyces CBS 606.96]
MGGLHLPFHLQKPLAEPHSSFSDKTIVVTGANSGLGFEAAAKFAALGAKRVILAVRDVSKGEQAKEAIKSRTGTGTGAGTTDVLEVWQLDMNSYSGIRAFATRASSDLDRLDIAVLNAGVFMTGYETSSYGWEETMQVNVLSTALLALHLLPKLKETARQGGGGGSSPVLEFVSSRRHEKVVLPEAALNTGTVFETFDQAANYNSSKQYQASKFFLMCVMRKLAGLVESDVLITAVCPGFCQSNLSRGHQGFFADLVRAVLNALVLRTSEQGSRALVSGAAVGPEGHGRLWYDDGVHDLLHPLLSPDNGQPAVDKVWDELLAALEKDVPETKQLLAELTRLS